MRKLLIGLALVVLVGGFVSAVEPSVAGAATTPPPTLQGEGFHSASADGVAGETFSISQTPDCDPSATSASPGGGFTASFSASGTTTGPYVGTFTESGTFTIGATSPDGVNYPMTSFTSTFTIVSGAYSVTGTRTMSATGAAAGACGSADGYYIAAATDFDYTATITGPEGTYTDSGTSVDEEGTENSLLMQSDDEGDPPPSAPGTSFDADIFSSQAQTTPVASDPTVYIADASVPEGNSGTTPLVFTVSLSVPVSTAVKVGYSTADGTALAGSDYTAKTGTVTIPKGSTSATVSVNVRGDTAVEDDEQFAVNLTSVTPSTVRIGRASATGTITNDDQNAVINISNAQVTEGDSGYSDLSIPLSLSIPAPSTIKVSYNTVDGTATAPNDYQAKSGTLTIPTGATQASITIKIKGDLVVENNKYFYVALTGVVSGPAQINGTVNGVAMSHVLLFDNDHVSNAYISDASVDEGNSGTTPMTFTVTLETPAITPIKITYATSDGTAVAGSDYVAKSGTLTLPQGATSGTITVNVKGDKVVEPDETFTVTLTGIASGPGALDPQSTATGTILNDDSPPSSAPHSPPSTPHGTGTPSGPVGSGSATAPSTVTPTPTP